MLRTIRRGQGLYITAISCGLKESWTIEKLSCEHIPTSVIRAAYTWKGTSHKDGKRFYGFSKSDVLAQIEQYNAKGE